VVALRWAGPAHPLLRSHRQIGLPSVSGRPLAVSLRGAPAWQDHPDGLVGCLLDNRISVRNLAAQGAQDPGLLLRAVLENRCLCGGQTPCKSVGGHKDAMRTWPTVVL